MSTTTDTNTTPNNNSNRGRTNNVRDDQHHESTTTTTISSNHTESPFSFSNSFECYACTQVGIPAFHSTSCDRAHQPEWEACAGSSLFPVKTRFGPAHISHHNRHCPHPENNSSSKKGLKYNRAPTSVILGSILDPRSASVRRLNRAILLARGVALAVDPLFFYALSIGLGGAPCLVLHRSLLAIVTIIRTSVDGVHACHLWLQFRLAYVSRESLVVGCGKLVWDPRAIAIHYVRSLKGFWFDLFVILPIPQVLFWLLVPNLVREQKIKLLMTILLVIFLFQFLPKVYHSLSLMRRMQKVTGYIFGTIWWGFGLNLIAYFIVSHVVGGCWYILSIQRVATCLTQHCNIDTARCNLSFPCSAEGCYGSGNICPNLYTKTRYAMCFDDDDAAFHYGIYDSALPVISSNSIDIKILYPISWGLYQLSTFGNNLAPTSYWSEVLFCICLVLGGVMLFTLLVGNIQVFLHAVMANKRKLQLRCRDMEWWMRRRQLPNRLRLRVRQFERQSWVTSGGLDEMELIKDLPEGLRRDIKRYLCLDLIKMVPLFHCLDDLILDNICDRVKPLIYSKDEKIVREGDAVSRMVFIVHGCVKSSQCLSKGIQATSIVKPGGFLGDELLSWCLRRPFVHRLPAASATFSCLESIEAFGLDAYDLRYITEHFRYKFANDNLKRTMRYYSANWRTWAAVNIQFAWRRHLKRTRSSESNFVRLDVEDENHRLRKFAAMFMSLRPHDHLD